jgi:SpoVK/Ycf46/Vps4 family AAA+-type ATPase
MIYNYQKPVYDSIRKTMHTHFATKELELPVRPRNHRLIVGPTGSGKTHIAEQVARELNWSVYSINVGSWIPLGGRDTPTWNRLTTWLSTVPGGQPVVIIMDELDKVSGEESWSRFLRAEFFALLDGKHPTPGFVIDGDIPEYKINETCERVEKMLKQILVIGCGAFQHVFDSPKHMGFGDQVPDKMGSSKLSKSLQRELVNRFSQHILVLPELTRADYSEMLDIVAELLPRDVGASVLTDREDKLDAAVEDKSAARFIEAIVADALTTLTPGEPTPWVAEPECVALGYPFEDPFDVPIPGKW